MSDLRVVHQILTSQPLVVRAREVLLDENGVTEPLTAEEHAYLVSIPIFTCAARFRDEDCPVCSGAGLGGEALVRAVVETFAGQVVTPSPEETLETLPVPDEDDEEADFEDLFPAWLEMEEDERCETVSALEDNKADEVLFRALFDFESKYLNGPRALAAIDTALAHLQPKRTAAQINNDLVRRSAEGKTTTKNPPSKPKRR